MISSLVEPNMRSALPKDVKISLKVMMNKQKTKVLFAEADSKSAEIILSFLTLPLGQIVSILNKQYEDEAPTIGSLNTLYMSLTDLESDHFCTDGCKKMLLNPRNAFMDGPVKHFKCGDVECNETNIPNVSMYYDSGRCDCGKPLNRAMAEIEPRSKGAGDGILVEGMHFLVSDDLKLVPCEPGSMIQTLIDLGIVVTEGAKQLNVTLGFNGIVDLLKGSIFSKTPLTDAILRVSNNDSEYALEDLLDKIEPEPTNYRRMDVAAFIQKSTRKLVFVKARGDFLDFILSFLTFPLGGVESLLRGKTSFEGIDNLYNSTTSFLNDKHFITRDAKRRLQEPELPPYYLSKNQLFSVSEQIAPPIYYHTTVTDSSDRRVEKGFWMRYKDPKGDRGCYVSRFGNFLIRDDLTVKQLSVSSVISTLYEMEVPLSDLEEIEVQIGVKEGLSILRAALASTSALTDGLINPLLKIG